MYAHIDHDTGEKQLLIDHLINVGSLCHDFAIDINQQRVGYLLGLLHDLGKADGNFQKKISNNSKDKVNHSSAGAKFLYEAAAKALSITSFSQDDQNQFKVFLEILSYVITAHHGLYDIPSVNDAYKFENKLLDRITYDSFSDQSKYHYQRDVIPFAEKVEMAINSRFDELVLEAFEEFQTLLSQLSPKDKSEKKFYYGTIMRLYLAILKSADIFDTINAYEELFTRKDNSEKMTLFYSYVQNIEELYVKYSNPRESINKVRTRIASDSKARGETDHSGVYRLDLPTGTGKTKASLRYALHQVKQQGKGRIFYITPFLSVLEQNAAEIKEILGEEGVLEHHSNIVVEKFNEVDESEDESKNTIFQQYLIDSWDSPVVLTTMVQFFQTLFKGKSSNIRRFASLCNSVIIMDEVQSLPIEVTTIFDLMVNFLSKAMNSTVILCTATQPKYDSEFIAHKIEYGGQNGELADIVSLTESEREIFNRTIVHKFNDNQFTTIEEIAEEIAVHPNESILVILNTKSAVNSLYNLVSETSGRPCCYLSTNQCPKHRQTIIKDIRQKIATEPIVCISTQLIEAGVDLDFNRLIRSYAGIDSIVQAMGRCNREGKLLEKGQVKLVKLSPDIENLKRLPSIADKRNVTEQIIADLGSPIDVNQLNDKFYDAYYVNQKADIFDYPIKKDAPTGYDLLSSNSELAGKLKETNLKQSFKTAAQKIDLIKNETEGVIVYYKEDTGDEDGGGEDNYEMVERLIELANEFEHDYDYQKLNEINSLLKKLQPYTVNFYAGNQLADHVSCYLDGRIKVLLRELYDSKVGVKAETGLLII